MPPKKTPQPAESENIFLEEKFDQHMLNYFILNEEKIKPVLRSYDPKYDPFRIAREMLKKSKNGTLAVRYRQRNGKSGRYSAIGGSSIQCLMRELRHPITDKLYFDVDIVNCHFTIARHICKTKGWACEKITEYVLNRNRILAEICDDHDQAKHICITVLNGGTADYRKLNKRVQFVEDLITESKRLHDLMINDYKDEYKQYEDEKKEVDDADFNMRGRFMNRKICEFENEILMRIFKFYKKPKHAVLMYDGLMLPKKDYPDEKSLMLAECEDKVKEKLGIEIKLIVKPQNKGLQLNSKMLEKIKNTPYVDLIREKPDHEITLAENYYWVDLKQEINAKVFKNEDELKLTLIPKLRKVYAHVDCGKGYHIIKASKENPFEFVKDIEHEANIMFYVWGIDDRGNPKKYRRSIAYYLEEFATYLPTKYNKVVVEPKPEKVEAKQFNLWRGFKAQRVEKVDVRKFWRSVFVMRKVWANSEMGSFRWTLQYFQFPIKNPGEKSRVGFFLYSSTSDQGCGKTSQIDYHGNLVLGEDLYYEPRSLKELLSEHNTLKAGKVLIYIAEIGGFSGKDKNSVATDIRTEIDSKNKQTVNPKGINMFQVNSIGNVCGSMNDIDAFPEEDAKSRKTTQLSVNPFMKGHERFWVDFYDEKKHWNQESANHYYTWLLDTDFKGKWKTYENMRLYEGDDSKKTAEQLEDEKMFQEAFAPDKEFLEGLPKDSEYNFKVGQGLRNKMKETVAGITARSHIKFMSELKNMLIKTEAKKGDDGKAVIETVKGKKKRVYVDSLDQSKLDLWKINSKFKISTSNMWKMYTGWCNENNESQQVKSRFIGAVSASGIIKPDGRDCHGDRLDISGALTEDLIKTYKATRKVKKTEEKKAGTSAETVAEGSDAETDDDEPKEKSEPIKEHKSDNLRLKDVSKKKVKSESESSSSESSSSDSDGSGSDSEEVAKKTAQPKPRRKFGFKSRSKTVTRRNSTEYSAPAPITAFVPIFGYNSEDEGPFAR